MSSALNLKDIFLVSMVIGLLGFFTLKRRKNKGEEEEKRAKRRVSFNTKAMMQGTFPDQAQVAAPILSVLLLFEHCPSVEKLKETWQPMLKYHRFRSKIVATSSSAHFVETEVNLDDQILTWQVQNEEELLAKVNEIATNELKGRENYPAWCINRIENLSSKGLSGVVVQIHHAIGDGISLVSVAEQCFKTASGEKLQITIPGKKENSFQRKPLLQQVLQFVKSLAWAATVGMTSYDSDIAFTTSNKQRLVMSPHRKIIILPSVKLDFIKSIKNKCGGTINDVVYAAASGAIRRYCLHVQDPAFLSPSKASKLQVRSLLAVAFPRKQADLDDTDTALRNKFTFVNADMHVSEDNAKSRLEACMKTMLELRNTPAAFAAMWLMDNLLRYAPAFFQKQVAYDLFSRHSLVFSNVPGPQHAGYFGGSKILALYAIYPNLINQSIMVSYDGVLYSNFVIDDKIVTDCDKFGGFFVEELKEQARAYGIPADEEEDILVKSSLASSDIFFTPSSSS